MWGRAFMASALSRLRMGPSRPTRFTVQIQIEFKLEARQQKDRNLPVAESQKA